MIGLKKHIIMETCSNDDDPLTENRNESISPGVIPPDAGFTTKG